MKFLFVTLFGESASLAQQLLQEGHKVRFFVKDKKMQDVGRGLIPRVRNWKEHIDWANVLVFDDVDFGKDIERLRTKGYLVVGGNRFGDRLENDRLFGQKIMLEAGMKIPKSWRFRNFGSAIKFVKKRKGRYVLKFNGQLARYLCYISKLEDGSDLLKILEEHQEKWPTQRKIDFILQEFIDGIEMACGAFFNGKHFVYPINISFEHKHFLTGGIGPLTGEMGTSMFYSQDGGLLFKQTLLKMEPFFAKTNYRGFIDINSMVTEKGAYPLEYTARFGYPQLDIQQELHKTEWGELLYKLAEGTLKKFEVYPKYAVGVVVGAAGMPFEVAYNKYGRGLPIYGITKENIRQIKLSQVCKRDGKLLTAGSGYVLTVNGSGKTMEAAKKRAYEVVSQIIIPNIIYRIDIGDHWKKEAPKLRAWGYI